MVFKRHLHGISFNRSLKLFDIKVDNEIIDRPIMMINGIFLIQTAKVKSKKDLLKNVNGFNVILSDRSFCDRHMPSVVKLSYNI